MERIRAQMHLPRTPHTRLREHEPVQRDALLLEALYEHEHDFGLFITITLLKGERPDSVLSNLRRACQRVGHELEHYSKHVTVGRYEGKAVQLHLHSIANVQPESAAHQAIRAFRSARNRRLQRSVSIRLRAHARGGIAGLFAYFREDRNDGEWIISRGVRRLAEELGRRDIAPLHRRMWGPGATPTDAPTYTTPGSASATAPLGM
jgi:hypothetical protein